MQFNFLCCLMVTVTCIEVSCFCLDRSVISYKTDEKPLYSMETVANSGNTLKRINVEKCYIFSGLFQKYIKFSLSLPDAFDQSDTQVRQMAHYIH